MFDMEGNGAGGDDFDPASLLRPNELLRNGRQAMQVQSRMEWERYAVAAELHRQLVEPTAGTDAELRVTDPFTQCAARIAAAQHITQHRAATQINTALALRDRLPHVNLALKHGRVSIDHIPTIVSRTELIDGSTHMADIDRAIAEFLARSGSWSKNRMRDMVDATIFRHDPDLVRQNRDDAKANRGVWANHAGHGMAVLDAQSTAEEMAMIMARLDKLAMSTCKADPRRKNERMADALFATVMGKEFRCQCPNDPKHPCTAQITTVPADQVVSGVDVKIVLHVIADQATLEGTATNPGFLDRHGVISGDHAQDIAARPETITRTLGNTTEPAPTTDAPAPTPTETSNASDAGCKPTSNRKTRRSKNRNNGKNRKNSKASRLRKLFIHAPTTPELTDITNTTQQPDITDESEADVQAPYVQAIPLPSTQPGDAYRPSAALDNYIRIRDSYCTWPGCESPAWTADLDHTCEYNHHEPTAGGATHPTGMKTLCRFHHMIKTHAHWLDDQYPDPTTGRTRLIFTTPEGQHHHGPAWTGDDLFPTLRHIIFDHHHSTPPTPPSPPNPTRPQSRTATKHARRQQERQRNRRQREEAERQNGPPPF